MARHLARRFDEEARFLRGWAQKPFMTGAVVPSGRALAKKIASYVDLSFSGPVIELGPGTGAVTEALIRRGVEQERLVLIEYNPDFCTLLRHRFPFATIIQGDAYAVADIVRAHRFDAAAACVSSLPLFARPEGLRHKLLHETFAVMHDGAPFIQFTYALASPVPLNDESVQATGSRRIWRNFPPARVWVYRKKDLSV